MEKILVISTMYPSKLHPSFGVFVKNQVEALKARGILVDVAAIHNPHMSKPAVIWKYTVWMMHVLFLLLTKGKQYDIVHAHYVYPSGRLALLFKILFRTRVVVTAHGGDLDKMAKKGRFFFNRTKQVLHQADHIIAVGEKLKQDMIDTYQVSAERITVLNMGVNRHVFKPMGQATARKALNIPETATIILFVGNMIKAKGVAELLEAYSGLKANHSALELHLIGAPKEPAFVQRMLEKITHEQIQDVHLHPPIGQTHIAQWLAAADVFVLPSYMEGFGLVALEAMSCHTPVVASDVGGLSYLLSYGAGRLIKPKDTASLRTGMAHVLGDKHLRHELIANGEEKAQQYDQERLIGQLIERYQQG
ncbi:glycosyltransferase [Lentibacillus salinarum]|uniref:Glycosyltransferase n=1 Tax=Lentibacillus salinarum TaxID=446820 RepID=A0ABW3ZZ47_9BACI